ncbi:hypothetical protein LTR28_013810 [Elasticomyces elasticus]|nr:hypothetical protein LTR28_013810 [Elasticomyces elasticus]
MIGVGASAVIFGAIRYFARPAPHTMTREYQEQSNEYLKEQNVEPITGISSEGYQGKGQIQSRPAGK